jgi:type IV secretion system protein TrbG
MIKFRWPQGRTPWVGGQGVCPSLQRELFFHGLWWATCWLDLVFCLVFASPVFAQEREAPLGADPRLLLFEFDSQQSYLILTRPKSVTLIQMSPEETILTAVAGDTVNFSVVVSQSRNYVMVRPKYEGLTTSLTLITNLRNYPLTLRSTKEALGKWYQRVQWSYPKDLEDQVAPQVHEAQLLELRTRQRTTPGRLPKEDSTPKTDSNTNPRSQTLEAEETPLKSPMEPSHAFYVDLSRLNTRYTIQGDSAFRPLLVFDDGVRTYFKMPHNLQSMPALFAQEEGLSQLVNYTVRQEHMVAQGLHPGFILKLADQEIKVSATPVQTEGFWGRFKP